MALRLRTLLLVSLVMAGLSSWSSAPPVTAADPTPPTATPASPKPASPKPAPAEAGPPPEVDPLGDNAACYVCHMTFVKEQLAKSHLAEKIACIKCHGLSAKHANDENIGATKPDITFARHQVDKNCAECHDSHDVPATKVLARFVERKLSAATTAICTDCHGTHKIDRALAVKQDAALK